MHLRINHQTYYKYSEPVFPEPQHLYFQTLQRHYLDLRSWSMNINPSPAGRASRIDVEGNPFQQCWYNQLIDTLTIEVSMVIESRSFNPLDFFVEPEAKHSSILLPYLEQIDLHPEMQKYARGQIGKKDILSGVMALCANMYERWEHSTNYDQDLLAPSECFKNSRASCRDLSWLMIALLRHEQIPARFVSGYGYNPELDGHELHAWVEAWLSGAGWVGFDPSSGLMTTEHYIPVCASYHPAKTLPVQGTFRGSAISTLKTHVSIELSNEA